MRPLLAGAAAGAGVLLLSQTVPVMRMTNMLCGIWGFAGGAAAAWVWSRQAGRRSVAMGALAGLLAGLVSGAVEIGTGTVALLFAPGVILDLPAIRASLDTVPRERPLTPEALLGRFEARYPAQGVFGRLLHGLTRTMRARLTGAGARERARWDVALRTFGAWIDAAERRDLRPLLWPWLLIGSLLAVLGAAIPAAGGAVAALVLPIPIPIPEPAAPAGPVPEGVP